MMQIDDFLELVRKRRSIRKFKPDPVPDELVEKILEAGRWAMSGSNAQPWEFIVVEDQSIIDQLAQMKYQLTLSTAASNAEERKKLEKTGIAQKESFRNASIVAVCNKVDWEP